MGFFDTIEGVKKYIELAEGFDGRELIEDLKRYLKPGSTLLEIGMGPGKDLDILEEDYKVTGSDLSEVFIDLYREKKPDADLMVLDAVSLDSERKFDCIYSNKVLQHLSKEDLNISLKRQYELLNAGGILFHTFWKGDKVEKMDDLLFVYYTEEQLEALVKDRYEILMMKIYTEMEDDDSIVVVLRKH